MTLVYHYTPGVSGAATDGPFDTARAGVERITAPTSRQAVFDAVMMALSGENGAGWTETEACTETSRVLTSPGESGRDRLVITVNQGRMESPDARYLQFGCAPSVRAGVPLLSVGHGDGGEMLDFGSQDAPMELQILASLDFVWVFVSAQSNQHAFSAFAGLLDRVGCSDEVLTVGGAGAAAGASALIETTTNPRSSGVAPGDVLTIIQQDEHPKGETVLVIEVLPGGVVVEQLREDYAPGSRIGENPCPLVAGHVGNGPIESLKLRSCYRLGSVGQTEFLDGPGVFPALGLSWPIIGKDRRPGTVGAGLGVDQTPEERSRRFICPQTAVRSGGAIVGGLPGLYLYPGLASFFPHDTLLRDRNVKEPQDYLPVRFDGYSSHRNEHFALGPTPS